MPEGLQAGEAQFQESAQTFLYEEQVLLQKAGVPFNGAAHVNTPGDLVDVRSGHADLGAELA